MQKIAKSHRGRYGGSAPVEGVADKAETRSGLPWERGGTRNEHERAKFQADFPLLLAPKLVADLWFYSIIFSQ